MTLFESAALGLVLAALLVKPSELPSIGRRAGRLAGRAVHRFQDMKRELGEYVDKNELRSVQDELEQTMGQLNKIRQDVRSVSSVRGMMMDLASSSGRHHGRTTMHGEVESDMGEVSKQSRPPTVFPAAEPYTAVIPVSAYDVQRARNTHITNETNKVPNDDGCETTGSGLLKAALEEERVAKTAAQFFNKQA